MYSFIHSFIYLYMYSVEWSQRKRRNGGTLVENDIHSVDYYIRFGVSARLSPLPSSLSFLHLLLLDSLRSRFSHVCELIYSFSLYSLTFPFLLTRSRCGGLYRREDVERSESSKLAARARRDRIVSRFSDRGQSAQQF